MNQIGSEMFEAEVDEVTSPQFAQTLRGRVQTFGMAEGTRQVPACPDADSQS